MPNSELAEGDIFASRYRIIKSLGAGAAGAVYLALEPELNRSVAVKILHPWRSGKVDPTSALRLEREAKNLALLKHRNIIQVYRIGVDEKDNPFLVMEYLSGKTLRQLLDEDSSLAIATVHSLALQIAEGLSYAQGLGIMHRDLKPENIMVVGEEPYLTPKIFDFGLSRRDDVEYQSLSLTDIGSAIGTPLYMSPEQCRGEGIDLRTDIYAFGCLLYEMLVGKAPFLAETAALVMEMQLHAETPHFVELNLRPGLSYAWQDLVLRCTKKDPAERFQSFSELIASLQELELTDEGQTKALLAAVPASRKNYRTRVSLLVGLSSIAIFLYLLCQIRVQVMLVDALAKWSASGSLAVAKSFEFLNKAKGGQAESLEFVYELALSSNFKMLPRHLRKQFISEYLQNVGLDQDGDKLAKLNADLLSYIADDICDDLSEDGVDTDRKFALAEVCGRLLVLPIDKRLASRIDSSLRKRWRHPKLNGISLGIGFSASITSGNYGALSLRIEDILRGPPHAANAFRRANSALIASKYFRQENDIAQAERYSTMAKELVERFNLNALKTAAYASLGISAFLQGQRVLAASYLKDAEKYRDQSRNVNDYLSDEPTLEGISREAQTKKRSDLKILRQLITGQRIGVPTLVNQD